MFNILAATEKHQQSSIYHSYSIQLLQYQQIGHRRPLSVPFLFRASGDEHLAKPCLWKDGSAEQGKGVVKEGVEGGEEPRTYFPPDGKRQESCNSFAFIVTGSSGKLKKGNTLFKVSRYKAIHRSTTDVTYQPNVHPCWRESSTSKLFKCQK